MWKKIFLGRSHGEISGEVSERFPQLSPKARQLLEILRSRARGGKVEISQAQLAELTGWHRDTVWRYLREARSAGVLAWERRPNRVNLYRLTDVGIVRQPASQEPFHDGREEDVLRVWNLSRKGGHTLITARGGMGKTHFLKSLSEDGIDRICRCDEVIFLEGQLPTKDFLIHLATELHLRGDLQLEVGEDDDPYWALEKLKVRELWKLVLASLAGSQRKYLLLIDDLDKIQPKQKRLMRELLDEGLVQVIATATSKRPRYADLWTKFFEVRLRQLPPQVQDRIIDQFIGEHGIPIQDQDEKLLELLKRRLHKLSRGNPRRLGDWLEKLYVHGRLDREFLSREMGAEEADYEYIDLTWFVIVTAAVVMAARYLGLGLHDRTLYIMAGMSYAFMLVLRYFSYRWRRK